MLQKYVPFPPGNQAGIFIRAEAVYKIFSNNCVYSTLLNFIPFNL